MRNKTLKNVYILIGIAVLLLSIIACSSSDNSSSIGTKPANETESAPSRSNSDVEKPTPTKTTKPTDIPQKEIAIIGERFETGKMSMTVLNLQEVNKISLFTPETGNIFIDLEVVIENTGSADTIPYNPFYFSVKDSDGQEFTTSFASLDPSLKSGELVKGSMVRGHVAFEVPQDSSGLVMIYKPLVIFGGYDQLRFDLTKTTDTPLEFSGVSSGIVSGKVGEQIVSGGVGFTILNVSNPSSTGGGVFTPENGYKFVDIEVVIENISNDEAVPYNPLYFKIKDAKGFEYSISFGSIEPSLKSGDLVKGDKARGHVTFEIISDSSGLIVFYEPLVIFGGYEEISIDLGQ